ncbi:MAG: HlyC/CorC family transporter [Gammaproteobacteria bacterium]|nr:HlyC/CorC family transporter [Gammaproteobacteria bacterium]MCP5136309.1 HlyC/CorC family transporter [Gammaproteobacteria bacterium]
MDSLSVSLIAIVLLLIANAFFVAAEFALVKAKGVRIDQLADQGSSSARLNQRIRNDLEAYLAACQLGITMASLGLGWVGEPAVSAMLHPLFVSMGIAGDALHTVSFLLGFLIFSSLHIVVGEQVPKTFAIRQPEPVSLFIAFPLRGFYLLAFPLNWLLNRASGGILHLFGVEEATHGDVMTGDELKGLIGVSEEHGHLETDKAAMLTNLFEFDTRTVGRVMVPRTEVDLLDLRATQAENMRLIRETGHSRFPLIDGDPDNPIGVVLAKELFNAMIDGDHSPWADLRGYARDPLIVPETMMVSRLFETMRSTQAHMAIVVDEYGDFAGLVSLEDLLEEIVGEIADELDDAADELSLTPEGEGWTAPGLISLGDMERALSIHIPDEVDANTLSGLLMARLGRLPVVGDQVECCGLRAIVRAIKDRHVDQVYLHRIVDSGEMPHGNDGLGNATD